MIVSWWGREGRMRKLRRELLEPCPSAGKRERAGMHRHPSVGTGFRASRGSSLAAAAGPANVGWHGRSSLRRASTFPRRAEI